MSTAVVLLSGGLDSAVTLAIAQAEGHACIAVSFDYGQRHRIELDCASVIAVALGAEDHRVLQIDASSLAGSALTGGGDVPHDRTDDEIAHGIPDTYVPARNLVFLSMALAVAETAGARHLYIGVNAVDYSGYPDCRDTFLQAFEQVANLATKAAVEGSPFTVHAPLLDMTKAQIVRRGLELGVDFGSTSSCYDPLQDGAPCGTCDSCHLRAIGFLAVGVEDPRTCA